MYALTTWKVKVSFMCCVAAAERSSELLFSFRLRLPSKAAPAHPYASVLVVDEKEDKEKKGVRLFFS